METTDYQLDHQYQLDLESNADTKKLHHDELHGHHPHSSSDHDHDVEKEELDDHDRVIIKDLHINNTANDVVNNTFDHKDEAVVDVCISLVPDVVVNDTIENEKDKLGSIIDDKERCRGFYTNHQKILLVGEGDFSFASSLATAFGSAPNIVATSLDSRDTVITMYSEGERNLGDLELRSAVVVHQVDVHTMDKHPQLRRMLFDRIVFNFPHAGGAVGRVKEADSWYIICHQLVVSGFFKAAREMVTEDGEIHVTHKTTYPYDMWNVVELAEKAGLVLKREAEFKQWEYPGYVNKKAYKSSRYRCKWDSSFPVGKCSTFMFSNIR